MIRYDLFEYVIMFFDFCNTSNTFQIFINEILKEYLNDFCIDYLNDILVYNEIKKKRIKHVNQIFQKFKKTYFFLNIDKCEFFVISMKYLNLIIIIDEIKMNSKKINIIFNWKFLKCIKNVQIFLDFANFYKKFIKRYFKFATSLSKLIKINEKEFVFFWSSIDFEKKVFRTLKLVFITIFILQHFNLDNKIWIKTNVSNYVVATILSQRNLDNEFHFVIFISKKMSSIECNYEIYDKKLLIIIKVFEKWRSKCVEISIKNFIKILTNHKNLKYFMFFKQFNRKQTRWVEFLFEFNFKIIYKSNVQSIKLNSLTQRFQNFSKNITNERHRFNHQTILKKNHLKFEIRKIIEIVFKLMNDNQKKVIELIVILYELSEKKFYANEKLIEKSFAKSNFENSIKKKLIEKLFIDNFID